MVDERFWTNHFNFNEKHKLVGVYGQIDGYQFMQIKRVKLEPLYGMPGFYNRWVSIAFTLSLN